MRLRGLLCAAVLVTGVRGAALADDAARSIETAELRRTLDAGLLAALDGPPNVAARAALAVGRTKRVEGIGPLRAHLIAADPAERAFVVYGLGLLGDGGSVAYLASASLRDQNSAVRYAAADALGRIVLAAPQSATSAVADAVLGATRRDPDPVVRAHAAVQLDAFGTTPYAARVVRGLQGCVVRDPVTDVRVHCAWAIFRGYAKLADAGFLRHELHDRDELVRVETLRAWGRRSDLAAANYVRPLLGDPSWRVQLEAGEALKRLAKLPPTEHLTADPPGLHLPALPPQRKLRLLAAPPTAAGPVVLQSAVQPSTSPTPPASASPATVQNASTAPGLRAPDPSTIPLASDVPVPATAAGMNAPAAGPHPRVSIHTAKGDVVVRLFPEWAPSTVANFLALAERGYFDGNRWFRIVPDFVVQTGDPNDNGEGDAGYSIPAEENPVEQRSGVIAMGLDYQGSHAKRDSAGTQFYINLSPQFHLDRDFTVFGEVESGFAVLANLVESDRMTFVRRIADD